MIRYPFSVLLLFVCFNTHSTASNNPTHFTGDVSVNCGSSYTSATRDGREWHGDADARPKFFSLLHIKGLSTASSVTPKLISADDPIPYKTARLSRSRFSFAFQVDPGQKILRLHFNPAPYKSFERLKDLFAVEAGPFTLLSNFSASLTANALGSSSFVKEFCVNIAGNQQFDVVFSPASSQSFDTYAFINGIEIISVPSSLSYFHTGDIRVQLVGKSLVYVDYRTALEIVHRLNIKQGSILSAGNNYDMFGVSEIVTKQKAGKINSITWKISLDVGFRYLVRLHFSELGLKIAKIAGVIFTVHINEMIVTSNTDVFGERVINNSIPWYWDYVVMMYGYKEEGKLDLLICLQSDDEFLDGHGPLKGFDIIKLSNPDNSLASPNPFRSSRDSSYQNSQNLHQVLGRRNVIATVAITLLSVLNIVVYILRQIWEASATAKEENMPSARAKRLCRRFSLAEIQLATRNFSDAHLIGRGGFGKVYKGLIDNGRETVAIKRQKFGSRQGLHEFLTEIEILTELRHVNLVSLIGYCNEHGEMILVYEYMACGTLADHLYKLAKKSDGHPSLTWKQRLTICIGAGRGLDYLHTGHSLVHRDVKASNILLDENFIAKVSDFGLAKHLSPSKLQSHVSTKVKGTFGYFDPMYFTTGKLTRKSDTYAFGVMLLEVLSGRPAVDPRLAEDKRYLTKWARDHISKGSADQIIASNLRGEISEDSLKAFVGVAERCLHDEPKNRPTMAQVVQQIEFALEQQIRSQSPAPNGITSDDPDTPPSYVETNSSVSTGKITVASTDVQNFSPLLEERSSSKVVSIEPQNGKKATSHKPPRFWLLDAFWNKRKPSGKYAGDRASKALIKDKQTVTMLPIIIPVDELESMTNSFGPKSITGEAYSGFYRGVMKNGQDAAFKKLDFRKQLPQEFLAQVSILSSLKHENVVELLGYCVDDRLQVLAYEFAPHGSLHDILHGCAEVLGPVRVLSWAQRVNIAVGAAKGLLYIHHKAQIHGGINSSNVLLFDDYNTAKVADFGMHNRASDMEENVPYSAVYPGTSQCYAPPEYTWTRLLSWRGDVYSFGLVLLELLTGQYNSMAMKKLSEYEVKRCVDPRLNGNYPPKAVAKMAAVIELCLQYEAALRPDMSTVLRALQPLLNV